MSNFMVCQEGFPPESSCRAYWHYFEVLMQSIMRQQEHFLLKIQGEFVKLSSWEYFEPAIAAATILIFFLLGRKTYESRFSHILNIINDSQNEKRRLREQLQAKNTSLKSLRQTLPLFKGLTLAVVLMLGIYLYLNSFQINIQYTAWGTAAVLVFWVLVILRLQWLEMISRRTEAKLQAKSLSSEGDAKEIMGLLGERVCTALKSKFERQLQVLAQQEALKECDLKKCHDEKKANKDLYQLYKGIIADMQQMSWCDICAQGLNTEANDLKIPEVQSRLKVYKEAAGSVGLPKKKELTNRLLDEYEMLRNKLSKICKRGCCIRYRTLLEEIKRKHHNQLQAGKGRLK